MSKATHAAPPSARARRSARSALAQPRHYVGSSWHLVRAFDARKPGIQNRAHNISERRLALSEIPRDHACVADRFDASPCVCTQHHDNAHLYFVLHVPSVCTDLPASCSEGHHIQSPTAHSSVGPSSPLRCLRCLTCFRCLTCLRLASTTSTSSRASSQPSTNGSNAHFAHRCRINLDLPSKSHRQPSAIRAPVTIASQ